MNNDRISAVLTRFFREVFDDDTIELRPDMTAKRSAREAIGLAGEIVYLCPLVNRP